ncbi:hypothetical protein QQM79_20395 [Marinobacteraceae bacterium S3BR75-40.1]
MNFKDLSISLAELAKTKQESSAVNAFLTFCSAKFPEDFDTDRVGLWEFSEFVQGLIATCTEHNSYLSSTVVRRFCRMLEKRGVKFKTSASRWRCPPKPDVDHFDPLSREEYRKLCLYLSATVKKIRERVDLCHAAESHISVMEKSGAAFASGELRFFKYQVTLMDALSGLREYYPDFPIDADGSAFDPDGKFGMNVRKIDYEELENPVKLLRKRFSVQRTKYVAPVLSDYPEFGFQDVVDILVPSEEEAAAIRKAICLETGWSPDLVARIDPSDYTFQDIDPSSDYVFLKTLKLKGTQRGAGYLEAKSMFAPSSRTQPESAYNLIRLWLKRTESLRRSQSYLNLVEDLGFEPFLVFGTGVKDIRRHGSLRVLHPEGPKGRTNSTLNKIYEKTLGFRVDERRLRPTHLYFKAKNQDIPFALLVTLFGHSHSAITDEFYQSGSHFRQDRKDKLSRVLSEIDDSISDGSFAGELIPLRETKSMEDKIYSIFSDHSNKNPIAVCSDPYRPTWPGHFRRQKAGDPCKAFNKCLLCSRSQVFNDNLPFVVDRYLYLEQQRRSLRDDQFSIFLDEYNAAKNVVDSWPYQEDVEEAKDRTFLEGHILPPIILGDAL